MQFLGSTSSSSSSVGFCFSSVDCLTKGTIQYTQNQQIKQSINEYLNEKIKKIHFCEVIVYDHKIKEQHQYLMLELKKKYTSSYFNLCKKYQYSRYIKLELCCYQNPIEIKCEYQNHKPDNVKKTFNTKSNVNFSNIVEYFQKQYLKEKFNWLYNECSKFCYDFIQEFTLDTPIHKPLHQSKVVEIYFGESEIEQAKGFIKHGYIVIKTENDIYLKCEISGQGSSVKLNFEISNKPHYEFKARQINYCTLGEIIKISDENWKNKTYQTISNNCFDYCKFIMRKFTNNTENELKVDCYEKKSMIIGASVVANVTSLACIGGCMFGPCGFLVGGCLGILSSFAIKNVVQSQQK
ncbi:hypothetical protein ABPG74_004562 [Tetrahymena malaccensis]